MLPALLFAETKSQLEIHGGTHNPMAPTADYIDRVFLPQIDRMGASVSFECMKYGFAPSGGGCIKTEVKPVAELKALSLFERGESISRNVQCVLANVNETVGRRELVRAQSVLGWNDDELELIIDDSVDGAGNVLSVEEVYDNVVIHASVCGMKSKTAERVANEAVKSYQITTDSEAAVDVRLADQLLLPLALSGSGGFSTIAVTNHIKTNVSLIEKFCPVKFEFDYENRGLINVSVK